MNIEEIYEDLKIGLKESIIKKEENMSNYTSFKVGGKADIFVKVKTFEELKYIINYANEKKIPIVIIGNGTNILVKDNGIRGITIQLDFDEIIIEEKEDYVIVTVGSGVKLAMLTVILQKKGISGLEFASRNSRNHRWSNKNECRGLW